MASAVKRLPDLPHWDYIAVLDFEANCIPDLKRDPSWKDKFDFRRFNNFKNEIIEIPTVVIARKSAEQDVAENKAVEQEDAESDFVSAAANLAFAEDYVVVDEFRSFVKPQFFPVTDFCTSLTGITQEQVDTEPLGGRHFPEVWKEWTKFMSQYPNALLVTCGDWDLQTMLPRQLKYSGIPYPTGLLLSYWCNIKFCFEHLYGKKAGGMAGMLSQLDLSLDGRHHSGIDDCRNIGKVIRKMLADSKALGYAEQDTVFATTAKSKKL